MNDNDINQFIERKRDHLRLSLLSEVEATETNELHCYELIHDSLPEINLSDVSIESTLLDQAFATPFFIAGMTAGHADAALVNETIAEVAASRGWIMGLGSQRRELNQTFTDFSAQQLTVRFPKLKLVANLGITQLIELYQRNELSNFLALVDRTQALLVAIHLNPLQEAIQAEGTPNFKNSIEALKALTSQSSVPVVIKETGSGMSQTTLKKLTQLNLFAVDVSGLGGTHWGRIEGKRAPEKSVNATLGETFKNWGVSTPESVKNAKAILKPSVEIWASGGVRSGLDAAKLLALGAKRVGFAKPALQAALLGAENLNHWMNTIEQELKLAMFCSNTETLNALNQSKLKGEE